MYMHRMIVPAGDWHIEQIDHVNLNRSDNRRANLRVGSPSHNHANKDRSGASPYRGITWFSSKGKWKAQIKHHRRCRHLGYFADPVSAALAYDLACIGLYGQFARPTFLKAVAP